MHARTHARGHAPSFRASSWDLAQTKTSLVQEAPGHLFPQGMLGGERGASK